MIPRLVIALAFAPVMLQANPIVGLWDSARTSAGGLGSTLEFRADGTFVEAATVIVNTYYRIVGDRLLIDEQPIPQDAQADAAVPIEIAGDLFRMNIPDGTVIEKQRLPGSARGQSPIAGVWTYRHPTGAMAFERYTDEGRMHFRLPMTSVRGTWTLNGTELVLVRSTQPETKATVTLTGDALTLTAGGRGTEYRRDGGGTWYAREQSGK